MRKLLPAMMEEWRSASNVGDWINEERLHGFLDHAARVVGYSFDETDWAAVSNGLRNTDDDRGQWYEYTFVGRKQLLFAVARSDPSAGSGIVVLRLILGGLDDFERGQLAILVYLMQV
jgi:hypothetical protein